MPFSDHALSILEKNYYARDKKGKLKETQPSDLMHRLANSIFPNEAELAYNLYDALMEQKVVFNSQDYGCLVGSSYATPLAA